MVFNPQSAGVYINEVDDTVSIPLTATTIGAFAGLFAWGPCFTVVPLTSSNNLVTTFGEPQNWNYETWYTAWNFLQYASNLQTVRTTSLNIVNSGALQSNAATTAVASANLASFGGNNGLAYITNATYNAVNFKNTEELYYDANGDLLAMGGAFANVSYVARYPGSLGNSLQVGQCDSNTEFNSQVPLSGSITSGAPAGNSYNGTFTIAPGKKYGTFAFTANGGSSVTAGNVFATTVISNYFANGDYFYVPTYNRIGNNVMMQVTGYGAAVTNSSVTTMNINFSSPYPGSSNLSLSTINRFWEFYTISPASTSNGWISSYQANSSNPTIQDVIHVVVIDQDGYITGTPNTVLETYPNLSRAYDAVDTDNNSLYYKTVINQNSKYIYCVNDRPSAQSGYANSLTAVAGLSAPYVQSFNFGQDGESESNVSLGTIINGYSPFQSKTAVPINLVLCGKSIGSTTEVAGINATTYSQFDSVSWILNNIVEVATGRGDCVGFFSPPKSLVVNNTNNNGIAQDLVNWAGLIPSSNRMVMDTGYKYQYDNYNNQYRWIPLNGDIAGLCVYNDAVGYPWTSPAGLNRGLISNAIKLAYSPEFPDKNILYPVGINPVVTEAGIGTYLDGDKTFTSEASAFSHINVRRLFLYVEKSVQAMAKYFLFELNDAFTQNQFKNVVNPFLKAIQGANGISDYLVVCDSTDNTATVVDSNQFLAAVYIKPMYSINFIQITFVATPDGVSFSTVVSANF